MMFTLYDIKNSIAGVLRKEYSYPIFSSPTQQGVKVPCFFIFFMNPKMENLVGDRFLEDIGIEIVLLQKRNMVDAYEELERVAQYLCEELELFEYTDGKERGKLRTYDREWKIEDGELHYQFRVKCRVSKKNYNPHMKHIEKFNGGVKDGS